MSHVSTIETVIQDLDALEQACKALGTVELVRGQTTWKWFGQFVNDYHGADAAYKHGIEPKDYGKCLHAIRVKGNEKPTKSGW